MITDRQSIQQLQFRSNLPRLSKEELFIFAQLEPNEQKLPESDRTLAIINAYAELIKDDLSAVMFDSQISQATPLAYQLTQDSNPDYEWLECFYAIEGDRNKYTHGKMKIYKKAFVYFSMDNLRSTSINQVPGDWVLL